MCTCAGIPRALRASGVSVTWTSQLFKVLVPCKPLFCLSFFLGGGGVGGLMDGLLRFANPGSALPV